MSLLLLRYRGNICFLTRTLTFKVVWYGDVHLKQWADTEFVWQKKISNEHSQAVSKCMVHQCCWLRHCYSFFTNYRFWARPGSDRHFWGLPAAVFTEALLQDAVELSQNDQWITTTKLAIERGGENSIDVLGYSKVLALCSVKPNWSLPNFAESDVFAFPVLLLGWCKLFVMDHHWWRNMHL
jgi:hypothetical protein